MLGFGNSPFGQFCFGTGLPDVAPPQLGEQAPARFIDPNTKDFSSTQGDGRLDGMPAIRQRVLLALTTTFGSAAASPKLGLDLSNVRKITQQFEAQVKAKVAVALYQMTNNEKVIRLNSTIVVVGASGRVSITVSYTDLTTNLPDSVTAN